MHKLSIFVMLLACLIAPVFALAQEGSLLPFGEIMTGEITNDEPQVRYTFEGVAGEIITINMSAEPGTLDSYLELLAPDGTSLLTADDYAGSLNSQVGPYTLPESGIFTVVATRCCGTGGGGSTGAYELVLREAQVVTLTVGETITAALSDEQPSAYFSIEGGSRAVLTLEAEKVEGDTPFVVEVRNPLGQIVNSGWQNGDLPVLIDPLFLAEEGSYAINVSRQQNNDPNAEPTSGSVTVSLALQEVEAQSIQIGETVTGELNNANPSDHYIFSGRASDLLRLEGAQGEGGEPFELLVFAPNGFSINGVNTGYVEPQGSFTLDPLQLFDTGDYLLVARRLDMEGDGEMGAGEYTFSLGGSEAPTLDAGAEVEGTVGSVTYERVYRFEGTAGQTIRITLRNADDAYAPTLSVQGPSIQVTDPVAAAHPGGNPFFINSNSSTPATLTYEVTLPESGTYLFRVSNGAYGLQGPGEGAFSLLVEVVS
jgi:hypothetical protein